ncbi:MAG: HAD hydrolase family protein, partial [Polyangia bacterium]
MNEPIQRLTDVPSAVWAELAGRTRGVFSDIDDTLTEGGHLVPEACSALHALRAAGLRTVLVTGRPLGWAEVLVTLLPVDAAIAENGAVAALPDGARVYFDDEDARRLGA